MHLATGLSFTAALLVSGSALADTVVLVDGGTLEGLARVVGQRVVVEMDVGSISVDTEDVVEIKRASNSLGEYQARYVKLRADEISGRLSLAKWCRARGLKSRALGLYREILSIDPNHPGARQGLGHRRIGGQWLTAHQQREAAGEVFHLGEWVSKDEAEKRDAAIEAMRERREKAQLARAKAVREMRAAPPPAAPMPADSQSLAGASTTWWWSSGIGLFGGTGFLPAAGLRPQFRGRRFPGGPRMRGRGRGRARGRVGVRPGVRVGLNFGSRGAFTGRATFGAR